MIVAQLLGGLGNQMFEYACGRHLALLNQAELKLDVALLKNRTPFNPDFVYRDFDLDMFDIQAGIATEDDIPLYPLDRRINDIPYRLLHLLRVKRRGFDYVLEWPFNTYNRMVYRPDIMRRRGNVYLAGYWASPKYFQEIREVLLADFSFRDPISSHCLPLLQEIRSSEAVCINIRRKEFVTNQTLGTHGPDYIARAAIRLKPFTNHPVFYVFSDDLPWCRANIRLDGEVKFIGEEYYGPRFRDYLELMIACRHFIITNSTFAWWAAWLGGHPEKSVIIPERCFLRLNAKDYIPPEWLKT
jgi:hypothetical protein